MSSSAFPSVARRSIEVWSLWSLCATIVLALIILTPAFALPAGTTKTYVLAAGTVLTLTLYIVARLSRGTVILPPLVLIGALWLPVGAYILSALFSGVSFGNALWGTALEMDTLAVMLVAGVLATLSALIVRGAEQYRVFLVVALGLYVGVALIQVGALLLGQVIPSISPSFSLVGTYEDLAFILGLGVIGSLVAYRFLQPSVRIKRLLAVVSVGALLIIAVANSLFVWIAIALVALGFFIESVLIRKRPLDESDFSDVALLEEATVTEHPGEHSMVPALLVLLVAGFFLIGGQLGNALASAFNVQVLSVSPSWQSTFSVLQETYAVSPVFGTGPGSFRSAWLQHRDPSINETIFWNVDFSSGIGVVPTSFVTTGLVGAVAWILLFVAFLGLGLRMLIVRTPEDSFIRGVAIFAFVGAVYLFAAAIFRLPSAPVFTLGFVFAGLFASSMRFGQLARARGVIFAQSPRLGFVIVFSLTLLLFGSVVVMYGLVGRYAAIVSLSQASRAFASGDTVIAEAAIDRSISFAPTAAAYQGAANLALVEINRVAASTTMPATEAQQAFQEALSSGINAALTATQLAPRNYQHWLILGNLYAQAVPLNITGAYDSATQAYERAQSLHPTSPEIPYVRAQLDIAHRDLPAAREKLKSAIELKRDYAAAIFLLSQIEVQSGNVRGALDSALSAKYFAPNDPGVLFQVGVLRAATADYTGAVEELTAAIAQNSQFANARYFLAAVYARQSNLASSTEQLRVIAELSPENAVTVAPMIASLQNGKNPFPANLLTITPQTVEETPAP